MLCGMFKETIQNSKSRSDETLSETNAFSYLDQISSDLSKEVNASQNIRNKLRIMSEKTGIHTKTLNRILNKENKPTYFTTLKIYRYIYKTENDDLVFEQMPKSVLNFLKKGLRFTADKKNINNSVFENRLKTDPVFAEIYLLSSSGVIAKDEIIRKFGELGISTAEEMAFNKILQKPNTISYTLGPSQIQLSPESILHLGLISAKNYSKPQKAYEHDQNIMTFLSESLSEEGFRIWIKADTEAYLKKIEVMKNSSLHGSIKVFSFNVSDTLTKRTDNE